MIKFIQAAQKAKAESSKDVSLTEVLIKNLGRKYPERSHQVVHASDVTREDFCPRQYLLMDACNVSRPDRYISPGLKATFEVGEATALLVVKWLGKKALGKWVNRKTGETILFGPSPAETTEEVSNWDYHEVKFFGQSTHISGSLDVIADLGHTKFRAVELKIIKVDDFDKLSAPLAEHRLRTALYLQLIADSANPLRLLMDTETAHILYVSRGFGKKNPDTGHILPFKEFVVHRDDPAIAEFLAKGRTVKECRETKTIPSHKVCPNIAHPTAKSCPVRQQCWA